MVTISTFTKTLKKCPNRSWIDAKYWIYVCVCICICVCAFLRILQLF